MTYLDFLQALANTGPNFPAAFTHVDAGVTHFREGVSEFQLAAQAIGKTPPKAVHNLPVPTPQEEALEKQLVHTAAEHGGPAHGAIGDGTLLRSLFAFLQSNPQLLSLLLSLLTAK